MNYIQTLLTLQSQLKVCHWQTTSYGGHIAYNLTYEELEDSIDRFIEGFSGKYARIRTKEPIVITLENLDKLDITAFIDNNIKYLTEVLPTGLTDKDTDLLNIRDEMILSLNKLKYLLTLE